MTTNRLPLIPLLALLFGACAGDGPAPADGPVAQAPQPIAAPGHYGGVLPCTDCNGLRTDLQLWAFGGCVLQERRLTDGDERRMTCRWGRWRMDEQGRLEVALDGGGSIQRFAVGTDGTLVRYAADGTTLLPAQGHTLAGDTIELIPAVGDSLKGTFHQSRPNVWSFRECNSGREMLVRFDPEAADIEEGFRNAGGDPAAGLVVELGGFMQPTPLEDAQGKVTLLTIRRWDRFLPGETCGH